MKSLSIVMPLYNAGADLPRVLQPLLAAISEGTALELVVVDDGSTDGGPETRTSRRGQRPTRWMGKP